MSGTDQVTKEKCGMSQEDASALAERTARDMCDKVPGAFWHWMTAEKVRVYTRDGTPLATIHVETIQ